jgi:hypothetical protein
MPAPSRHRITTKSTSRTLTRAPKDAWARGLCRRLGPEEFYRRWPLQLRANGRQTSVEASALSGLARFAGRYASRIDVAH